MVENHPSLAKIMGFKKVEIKTVKLKDNNSIILELLDWEISQIKKRLNKKNKFKWNYSLCYYCEKY